MTQNETTLTPPTEPKFRPGDIVKLRNGTTDVIDEVRPGLITLAIARLAMTESGGFVSDRSDPLDIIQVLGNMSEIECLHKVKARHNALLASLEKAVIRYNNAGASDLSDRCWADAGHNLREAVNGAIQAAKGGSDE